MLAFVSWMNSVFVTFYHLFFFRRTFLHVCISGVFFVNVCVWEELRLKVVRFFVLFRLYFKGALNEKFSLWLTVCEWKPKIVFEQTIRNAIVVWWKRYFFSFLFLLLLLVVVCLLYICCFKLFRFEIKSNKNSSSKGDLYLARNCSHFFAPVVKLVPFSSVCDKGAAKMTRK